MIEKKQWYAIYTRPRWERKVAEQLNRYNIEAYCPLNKICRQRSDRKKMIDEPLFTSYIFVFVSESERIAVRRINTSLNFVYWLGKPAIIRDEEIDAIKNLLQQYQQVTAEKMTVNVNDRVKITNGALMHREGNIIEVQSKNVKVYLPTLGYQLVAEVRKSDIEILSFSKKKKWHSGLMNLVPGDTGV